MADDQDDIFVIDKSGSSLNDKQLDITYDFTDLEEESLTTSSQNFRSRKPVYGKRYHEADFVNKFRPGRISRELRKALNLSSHDIPVHIYRMRTLGYPPGWLKKAAIGGSLQIFDSDNLDSVTSERKVSYNRSALIGYPGFNVELDRSVRDDYLFLKCPPMQKYHMLDNFYASLSGESSEKSSITSANGNPSPCSIKKTVETAITISDSESGETNSTSSQMEDTPDEVEVLRPNPDFLIVHAAEQGTPTPICPLTVTNDFPNENTDHSSFLSSQALKRPSLEAFSMGIQPYRPFENLPGVHGGYQRVLKSLKNSRESLASHSNPSDSKNLRDNDFQSPSARLNRHNGIQSPHKRSRY